MTIIISQWIPYVSLTPDAGHQKSVYLGIQTSLPFVLKCKDETERENVFASFVAWKLKFVRNDMNMRSILSSVKFDNHRYIVDVMTVLGKFAKKKASEFWTNYYAFKMFV